MRTRPMLLLCGLVIILAACSVVPALRLIDLAQEAPDEQLVAHGVEVYRSNYCGTCHTLTIANTRGTFGPAHDHAGQDAARYIQSPAYSGTATTPAAYIRESLIEPGVFYTPGYESTNHHMPAFTHLPAADIEALVVMLVSQ